MIFARTTLTSQATSIKSDFSCENKLNLWKMRSLVFSYAATFSMTWVIVQSFCQITLYLSCQPTAVMLTFC